MRYERGYNIRVVNEVHHHGGCCKTNRWARPWRHLGDGIKTGMDGRTYQRCWIVQEQGGMLGCEPTHVAAEHAMHYDLKAIRADQCSAKGDEVCADAIPLSHSEVSDGCQ